uniref:Aftiphilin clathrin-binding box domain-containing protein n=1 Tax=Trichuris muris TaxID=70415 RepID=A0A5S6QYH3_TRIMR
MEPGPSKHDGCSSETFSAFDGVQTDHGCAQLEAASNCDDDFGDFTTAAGTSNDGSALWIASAEPGSIATNWADFPTALYSSSSSPSDEPLCVSSLIDHFDRLVCASFPDVASGSEEPRIVQELETLPSLLRENDAKIDGVQPHQGFVTLWQSLRSLEEATALQFRWNDSLLYSVYLSTLGMNLQLAQKIKCPYPAFAAQLSQASLKPEKCADIATIDTVLPRPASPVEFRLADANPTAFQLSSPMCNDLSSTCTNTASNGANSFPLDIFSLTVDDVISAGKPTWQEDLEQLGLMEKSVNRESVPQPVPNGIIGSATKGVPKATVNVLPVLPPPPAGVFVRHKLEPK